MRINVRFCYWILIVGILSGCANRPGNWGGEATLTPSWQQIKAALRRAAASKHTWIPLTGAALFGIDDYDQKTVDSLSSRNPLFDNRQNANEASDQLSDLAKLNLAATVLAVPSGENAFTNKTHGAILTVFALSLTHEITGGLKSETDRLRPNESNRESFPSGHTSGAATAASLSYVNIEHMNALSRSQRDLWQAGSYSIAGLTGWARIEANRHYPSDVLAGYALGNFVGLLVSKAFIAPDSDARLRVYINAPPGVEPSILLSYRW